ncbi:MAG: hypothetical protein JJU42_04950 [Rhodobacteraceae bacterium]|nr:hypothetical protein [Paracoccaceae bacterium]
MTHRLPHCPFPFPPGLAAASLGLALVLAAPLPAGAAERETYQLQGSTVTVIAHDFLNEQEMQTLRLVGTDPQALALFMGDGAGHGAIAVAPAQGFIRDGMPAAGVAALAQLPDAQSARDAALAMCEEERQSGPGCTVVLELSPD